MRFYIIQRRISKEYNWFDYWIVGDLKIAKNMVKSLRSKYREEFRLIKEFRV